MFKKVFLILVPILLLLGSLTMIFAEPNCDDPNQKLSPDDATFCINKIEEIKNLYLSAQSKNKKDLAALQTQLTNLTKRINNMIKQLKNLEVDIAKREEELAFTRRIFEEKVVNQYKSARLYEPFLALLSSSDAPGAFREIALRQRAADGDRKTIEKYAEDLLKLKNDKSALEKNKVDLAAVQKQISEKTNFLAGEVAKVETYLATLSANQQAFLAQKLESLGLSRSAYNMKGGCSSDINPYKSPGFGGPAFAFFTFGVPNRVGLNQFGAKARAEAGQDYEPILRAYYNFDQISTTDQSTTIVVNGTNEFGQTFNNVSMPVDEYLKHLYEMPTSWDAKALRAQAIAARSYALRVQKEKGYVKPSQSDQVVKKELNDGNWIAAVNDTSGKVMLQGGQPIKAWFSSTHGGYTFNSGDVWFSNTPWTKRMIDAPGGIGSFSDLFNNAFDKNSPIFYCDWGSRASYNKTAWLKPEELADIANVILLAKADGSTQQHLVQIDKPNPDGVDTWDAGRVKNELSSRGITPLNSVSSVSIGADFGSGKTTSVTIDGRSFDGQDFKTYYNLRAPSNIQIVGPLFNVEKR